MTLIGALELETYPLVLGDILISQTGTSKSHISVPTRTDLSGLLPADWLRAVIALKRKVTIINDGLAMAWTGSAFAAARVLNALRLDIGATRITEPELVGFLNRYKDDVDVNCTLIGWLVEQNTRIPFKWSSRSGDLSTNQPPYIEGSGASQFA